MSAESKELEMRREYMRNIPFCPDHRDKVKGKSCRECEIEFLRNRIDLAAHRIAPDYPNIGEVEAHEQLYAIESAYKGTCKSNEDLHQIIAILKERLGMSDDELLEMSLEIIRSNPL